MICKTDIGYELEIQENISASEIEEMYCDSINIWLTGSGAGDKADSHFRYILQYKNKRIDMAETVQDATANQAYLYGAIHAVKRIDKPCKIRIIIPVALGFESAFKGKGNNSGLINTMYDEIFKRKCTLTEVRFINGASAIKSYIAENSKDPKLTIELHEKADKKAAKQYQYKEIIYKECLEKVCKILADEKINNDVMSKLMNIKP